MQARVSLKSQFGFTMIELLVVLAVLGVLASALLPLGEAMLQAQKERELRQSLWEIRNALDEYKRAVDKGTIRGGAADSGYPPNLKALTEGVADARPSARGQTFYILRRLPRDPFANPSLPAEQTWRLRSYASSPDRPVPGADVFDVFSSSNSLALDGSAYAKW